MESIVLKSMVDYVLERSSKSIEQMTILETFKDGAKITNQIFNYAKFLSMPLTLGMFVPTDENGNVLEVPLKVEYKGKRLHDLYKEKYQKALYNVIFEGFTAEKIKDYYVVKSGEMPVWVSWNKSKKAESLLQYSEIILTKSAITKYQI